MNLETRKERIPTKSSFITHPKWNVAFLDKVETAGMLRRAVVCRLADMRR